MLGKTLFIALTLKRLFIRNWDAHAHTVGEGCQSKQGKRAETQPNELRAGRQALLRLTSLRNNHQGVLFTWLFTMSQLEPVLPEQPSVPEPTPPVSDSAGEEKKTAPPDPDPASVQESQLVGHYPEPPAMFPLSPGNGLYTDGMYHLLQPGYPQPYTQALMGIMVPPPPPYISPGQTPLYSGEHPGAAAYDSSPWTTEESQEQDYEEKMPANTSSASRARVFVKSKIPEIEAHLDRRAKKNAQSRARNEKLRQRVEAIANMPDVDRTEEEQALLDNYDNFRSRKNLRSRNRALEKKSEVARIISIPEEKRSKYEIDFLETMMTKKQQKNHNDRMRRAAVKAKKSSDASVHEV